MEKHEYGTPHSISGKMIKVTRKHLGMTQQEFAEAVHCSKPTIERWESSTSPISGPITVLIDMLFDNPEWLADKVIPERRTPLRLHYMYLDKLCTIIDVDEGNQKIRVANFTDKLQFRAFGKLETPSFQDYEDFIESRCFPSTRDKMKIQLEALGIPFYDPILIIEKTEGRMAEDDFWIRIER